MRVVQPPPGPMPTLMPSAPRSSRNVAPSRGRDIAGDHLRVAEIASGTPPCARSITTEWPCAMSMTMHVDAGAEQLGGALEVIAGRANRGADAQPAAAVAGRKRHAPLAHEVTRGDQSDQRCRRRRPAAAS